jgi:predicted molibdopterin-dependent oxidoreductase YjgC
VNEGNLCGRGRFGIDYIYSENRLRSPMIRNAGELIPVTWQEALDYITRRLTILMTADGQSSIGAIGSPRCTNEENYLFQKFMTEGIGTNNIDSSAAFGYGLVEKAWKMAFGKTGHRIDMKAPLGKDVILVIESDPSVTHPVLGINILKAKREGSNLIVVDSKKTKMTKNSTEWTRIKQGTGVALLNGIMKLMIDRELHDKESASQASDFSSLEESLKDYTPDKVSAITGIGEEELVSLTEALANAESRMLSLSIGSSENTKGLDTVLAAANLINLLGESPEALQIPISYGGKAGCGFIQREGIAGNALRAGFPESPAYYGGRPCRILTRHLKDR